MDERQSDAEEPEEIQGAVCLHGCECLKRFQDYLVHVAQNPEVQEFINEKWIETKERFNLSTEVVSHQPAVQDHPGSFQSEEDDEDEQGSSYEDDTSGASSTTCFGPECGCQGGTEDCFRPYQDHVVPDADVGGGNGHVANSAYKAGFQRLVGEARGEALQEC